MQVRLCEIVSDVEHINIEEIVKVLDNQKPFKDYAYILHDKDTYNETDETKPSDKNETNEMKEMIEEENVPKTTLEKLEEMRRQRDSGMNEIEKNTNNNDDISNDLSMEDKNESD